MLKQKTRLLLRKFLFLIITFGGLFLIWLVNLIFFPENPGFLGISLHPYLVLVIVVASLDGFAAVMLTAAVVSISYGLCLIARLTEQNGELARIFQFSNFSPFISFLVVGTVVGLIANRQKKTIRALERNIAEARQHIDNLHEELTILQEKNVVLKKKCLTEREFLSLLYNASRRLSTLRLPEFQNAILDTIHEAVEAEKIAVFMLQGDKLILAASRGYSTDEPPEPFPAALKKTIEEKRVLSIKDIGPDGKNNEATVFIAAPLSLGEQGEVVGVVWIEDIPFLHYTPLTIRIVTILCDWASLCLVNLYAFEALRKKSDEKTHKINFAKVLETLRHKYGGAFEFGTGYAEIEKDLGKKIS